MLYPLSYGRVGEAQFHRAPRVTLSRAMRRVKGGRITLQRGVIQVSGLAGQGIAETLEQGLADLSGTGAFIACTIERTDAEIVGLANGEIRGIVGGDRS